MKNIFKVLLIIGLVILIAFGGKYIYDYKNSSNNKDVISNEVSSNDVITDNKNDNKESDILKDISEEEKERDYITLDINSVRIPILMYHSISDADPNNNLLVPVKQFDSEVKWLKENGFTPMLLGDVIKAYNTGYVPKKPVAITFDDGYADNYSEAYRILKENDMKATFFIITNNTDKDSFYMNSSMLKEMNESGMGIENHTSRHIEFTNISREDKIAIIEEGRAALKEKLGIDSKFLCYPVGRYDDETIEVEKELGIEAAVTTEYGISDVGDGLYTLKRIRMLPMDIDSFKDIFEEFI